MTAGTLVADDGETPVGSIFIDAKDRATVGAFTRSDPYHINGVWGTVQIGYNKAQDADRVAPGLGFSYIGAGAMVWVSNGPVLTAGGQRTSPRRLSAAVAASTA